MVRDDQPVLFDVRGEVLPRAGVTERRQIVQCPRHRRVGRGAGPDRGEHLRVVLDAGRHVDRDPGVFLGEGIEGRLDARHLVVGAERDPHLERDGIVLLVRVDGRGWLVGPPTGRAGRSEQRERCRHRHHHDATFHLTLPSYSAVPRGLPAERSTAPAALVVPFTSCSHGPACRRRGRTTMSARTGARSPRPRGAPLRRPARTPRSGDGTGRSR